MASSANITALNQQLRSSPDYAQWMQANRIDPSGPIRLSDQQRQSFAAYLRTHGWSIPKGAEIDPAGNINENEGFGKQAKRWGPIAGQIGLGIATGGMSLPAQLAINAGAGAGIGATQGGWKGAGRGAAIGATSAYGGHLLRGGPATAAMPSAIGSGAAGALPTSSYYTNLGIQTGMRGAPSAIARLGGQAAVAGGRNIVSRIGGGLRKVTGGDGDGTGGGLNAWQQAALALLSGVPGLLAARSAAGMSDEEKAIYALFQRDMGRDREMRDQVFDQDMGFRGQDQTLRDLQLRKIQHQTPLYEAVTRLAMNRLPTSVQQPLERV